ncbi:hypothetical protein PV10_06623 [Exophiala mesophila]|uniref:Uncharacterized protein n=1 Tax=Exophiala mesophila TaxID=212818 RepID=A0A0D1ZBT3_EXOME|nr:uncharacterized protein PV10_06623 [Exophiala mesophila]KIV92162.1 hypothetical protein PV10_06623 [Exophiala mesophila]
MSASKHASSTTNETPSDQAQAEDIYRNLYNEKPDVNLLMGKSHFQDLLGKVRTYDSNLIHRLKVLDGVTSQEDITCERLLQEEQSPGGTFHNNNNNNNIFQAFFLRYIGRGDINLTKASLCQLLQATKIPPSFLEILTNNNGFYTSYLVNNSTGSPTDYYLLITLPFGPFANGTLILHHNISQNNTKTIISAANTQILVERCLEILNRHPPTTSTPHPMTIVAVFLTHILHQNESHRKDIDTQLCRLESLSGFALHNFGSRTRAKVSQYALLKSDVHMQEAKMAMARHCFSFQDRLSSWIVSEMDKLTSFITTTPTIQSQSDHIRASLGLNASVALWTLEQLQSLERRLTVQSRVIDSTISTADTLTMIRLARSSRSDSNTMKAITILTMVFLPATFICSLFGMGFFGFDFGSDSDPDSQSTTVVDRQDNNHHIRIADQFWVYFAITVPLTILVLAVFAAWLRWGDTDGHEDDGYEEPRSGLSKLLRDTRDRILGT